VILLAFLLTACGTSQSAPTPRSAATQSAPPQDAAPTSTVQENTPEPGANIANPASENCVQQGGAVSIQKNSDGSEYGLCVFPDGKQCEEWALLRGECPVGGIPAVGLTPSGNTNTAEFGRVKIAFDDQLAKSAKGEPLAAIPVSDGPALGGASPAAIRFLFDGASAPDYFDSHLAQVLVYKTAEWEQLDPAIAQSIADLRTLLAAKPAVITDSIPVLPPISAAQVFHAQTRYLDFANGSGVGFVTHYAQDVSPVMAYQTFYTFQGLTDDGQYYVAVFFPVTTALLPGDPDAALGGQTYDEWAQNYSAYMADLTAQLDGLLPAAYTPDLTLIQELVNSINIEP
jgi:putative hemolysin